MTNSILLAFIIQRTILKHASAKSVKLGNSLPEKGTKDSITKKALEELFVI